MFVIGHCSHLQLIRQLRPFLELEDLKTVVHTLVTSRLNFCNVLYIGLPLCLVQKLQLVQNMAESLVTGTPKGADITLVLKSLHWLPISFWVKYKVLVIAFKALHGPLLDQPVILGSSQDRSCSPT